MQPSHILFGAIQRAGLMQKDAARLLGISPAYLSDVISGRRRVTPELAELVCDRIEKEDADALRADFALFGAMADGCDVRRIRPKAIVALRDTVT